MEPTLPLFSAPIVVALQNANLSLSDLTSVILFGGNTRVPAVQSAVRSVLGPIEDRIAQNVNTDEAAVLGAAYYGASLSRQFRMKSLAVDEMSAEEFTMGSEVVFQKGARLGSKMTISFPAGEDTSFGFSEGLRVFPQRLISMLLMMTVGDLFSLCA